MERVKLIWDFRGPNAAPIASHHAIHLKEFSEAEKIKPVICNTAKISEHHHIAYLIVEKKWMDDLRQRLKPNRGQRYIEPDSE